MKPLHTILDTPLNRLGLIDLSPEASCLIAYPASAEAGSVHIFDCMNLSAVNTFTAHDGPLACLKFNADGSMIATASIKGTVIRVYSVPQGTRLFEFRRGMSRESTAESSSGWLGYLTQAASNYLPTQVNELMTVERSFATAILPGSDKKNVAAMPTIKGQPHLLVATTDGFLYCYRILSSGGECDLVKMHRIGVNATETNRTDPNRATSAEGGARVPDANDPEDFPTDLIKGQPHLLVATTDGFLYCYRILSSGGECDLVKMHRIGVNATETNRTDPNRATNAEGGARVPDANDPEDFPPICHTTG
ncbi:hypothetical protein COOONC_14545 [Cooperia oncophora]